MVRKLLHFLSPFDRIGRTRSRRQFLAIIMKSVFGIIILFALNSSQSDPEATTEILFPTGEAVANQTGDLKRSSSFHFYEKFHHLPSPDYPFIDGPSDHYFHLDKPVLQSDVIHGKKGRHLNHLKAHSSLPIHPHPYYENTIPYGPHLPKHPDHCVHHTKTPVCSYNTTKSWCLHDYEYPVYEIENALRHYVIPVLDIYADVADLSTENSVTGLKNIYQETYLCSSEASYIRPLRAINVEGKWRTIVNNVKVNYDLFSQSVRIEECLMIGKACSLVPNCYDSKCLQKSVYHRFLVYDDCDPYFPFTIETFKLPSSCSCAIGEVVIHF